MMNSTRTERSCDGCGKPCSHFHRRYKEKRYCQSCYQLLFRKRECPSCGRTVTLYVEDPGALCSDCEKKKPCVRCGRVGYRLGKFTRYGPVCSVCVRWFGEMKTCSRCGKPSRFLGRVTRTGITEPLCPACARKDHARCQMCTRYRLLKKNAQGMLVCRRCEQFGSVKCEHCQGWMPAGYGRICEQCYWQSLFDKRLTVNGALFTRTITRERYFSFCRWLKDEKGVRLAAMHLNRYSALFMASEKHHLDPADWMSLTTYFSPGELRRYPFLERWYLSQGNQCATEKFKKENAEACYLSKKLQQCGASVSHRLLTDYYAVLDEKIKSGRMTVRSCRMALHTAWSLMNVCSLSCHQLPLMGDVKRYLRKAPGQRNNLQGFISYLNIHHGTALQLPRKKIHFSERSRRRLEKQLIALIREGGVNVLDEPVLRIVLACFHDLTLVQAAQIVVQGKLTKTSDGLTVTWKGKNYWVPVIIKRSF